MAKMQRVKKVHLWSLPKILAIATLAGIPSVSCLFGMKRILEPWRVVAHGFGPDAIVYFDFAWAGFCISVLFGIPAIVVIRYHPRFRRWWHGFFFGAVYALVGLATAAMVAAVISYLRFGGPTRFPFTQIDIILTRSLMLSIISGGLLTLLWAASRRSRGKLKIVHGTQCPTCEYNLVGNTTYICPECGQPFTLEELDVSADDLKPG